MKTLRIHLLPLLLLSLLVVGCPGTRAAYKAADSHPDLLAFVVAEHYSALVHEAANLKDAGAPADAVAKMQAADDTARPLVFQLKPLTDAYVAVASAENREVLEKALGEATVAVSNFINVVRGVRR